MFRESLISDAVSLCHACVRLLPTVPWSSLCFVLRIVFAECVVCFDHGECMSLIRDEVGSLVMNELA